MLIPMPLADTLLRLASGARLYLPRWTDRIMEEVGGNLVRKFGLTEERASYREGEIRRHFPEAWVEGYEHLIPVMTNDPKDRHVLAAAVRCNAEVIVTSNVKDFPRTALEPYSITAMGPGDFLQSLFDLDPECVTQSLARQAAAIGKPLSYLLDRLVVNAAEFAGFLKRLKDWPPG